MKLLATFTASLNRTVQITVVFGLLLVLSKPLFGWGWHGHHIVGAIAWNYLDGTAKAKVLDLLDGQTLADVSYWADYVKAERNERKRHWINVPRDATTVDLARDGLNGETVLGAIEHYSSVLQDQGASRWKRAEAVKYLVHYVGDVHQPLHVSYSQDSGGNNTQVLFYYQDASLHWVWDSGLIEETLGKMPTGDWQDLADQLVASAPDALLAGLRSETEGAEWANESLEHTRSIYAALPNYNYDLRNNYYADNRETIEQRLLAGGVRLAELLNRLIGEPSEAGPGENTVSEYSISFWNVENLFDTEDDPTVEKDERFTPQGPKHWTENRLATKYEHLARVIKGMNQGVGPDLLGLCEVENRAVLEGLLEYLEPLGRSYEIVHKDSPSDRGIDCALLYDGELFELEQEAFLFVDANDTRDIIRADLRAEDRLLTVFVNHWPSRSGDPVGTDRIEAARVLRGELDSILQQNRAADVVVLGDLNDKPDDQSVKEILRAKQQATQDGDLLNTMWGIHGDPGQGTYKFGGWWQVIDHVIVSQGLLDDRGFRWVQDSTRVIRRDYQMYLPGTHGERPNRTYGGNVYYGGYSDHLPVTATLAVTSDG